MTSYRLVSNLCYLSKLVEKAMLEQITSNCNTYNLLHDYQSAYRENRTCETVLLHLVNDLLWAMERKNVTALVALHLSTAFDTVNHEILLKTINYNFSIDGTALEWIRNYLVPRDMKIKTGKSYSQRKELTFPVPKGSCLDANFLNMYCSKISEVINPELSIIALADDHAIVRKFNPNLQAEEMQIRYKLITNLASIKLWMNSVRLKMNNTKSEFIIFGIRVLVSKCISSKLNINGEAVSRSQEINSLRA